LREQRKDDAAGLLSAADWVLVDHWQHSVRQSLDGFAPVVDQVAVVSLLLAAQAWAIRGAGFAKAWEDGNNNADLVAWRRRVWGRIGALAESKLAQSVMARALAGPDSSGEGARESLEAEITEFMEGVVSFAAAAEAAEAAVLAAVQSRAKAE